ncbi:MAG: hypothetical protein JKY17_03925 [Magnetovibrio sp.]|nr:hypothetical protein [Magnetovibrio sp.]
MKSFLKPIAFALALGTALTIAGQSFAQSTLAMKFLSQEERHGYNLRLQKSNVSSERSKITAEMNRAINKRRIEQRRLERAQAPKKP